MRDLKVGVIDDHNLFIKGFILLLKSLKQFRIEAKIESVLEDDFLQKLEVQNVDLIFVDLNLENSDGIELIEKIRNKYPTIKVLVVSMIKDSKFIREAFKVGADGFISKETDLEDLEEAIERILEDEVYFGKGIEAVNKKNKSTDEKHSEINFNRFNAKFHLTKREIEILQMLVDGKTSKERILELLVIFNLFLS